MTTVAMSSLDLSKIKRSQSSSELSQKLADYLRNDERLRAEFRQQGMPVPDVRAQR
ncbi:hypothetical protein HX137_23145 [Pseudomonas sp. 165]|uniref:hypothetical protein n=1 Tax=Pseudomonas sp. 165 TaxID=2746722 RepID=UPI00257704C8|nr:hypothetical protein [Pseudomonas sp. 165]MDM1713529.1 hypothetical protein [Pseudomonas sp. 165]